MAPEPKPAAEAPLVLPLTIIGPGDVGRVRRELGLVDDFLRQAAIRKAGEPSKLPPTTAQLDNLAQVNKLNLLQAPDRAKLTAYLESLSSVPVMHISFATDPSETFMVKIIKWFRDNIHKETLIQVGLQPNIAAGCVLRTPNKQFDFSLKSNFGKNRDLLIQKIHEVNAK